MIIPSKLKHGDTVRIVAPARSLAMIAKPLREIADRRFAELGLKLTFGRHVEESDEFVSASIEHRVEDLHEAFTDPSVKAIVPVIGGFNSNQLLRYLDWDLIRKNPKIFCGYSDITTLQNSIFAKTGLVTYSSPAYSTFGKLKNFEYALEYFRACLFADAPYEVVPAAQWSNDEWWLGEEREKPIKNAGWTVINEGAAEGTLLGANLCTFNLLQGTEYMPKLPGSVLFLEDDETATPDLFDRDLQSLIHQPGFDGVRGLVIGRFEVKSKMTDATLKKIIEKKRELSRLPVIANADFGHTYPMITFPIGGTAAVVARQGASSIKILKH